MISDARELIDQYAAAWPPVKLPAVRRLNRHTRIQGKGRPIDRGRGTFPPACGAPARCREIHAKARRLAFGYTVRKTDQPPARWYS
jgi:hypothetical protein